MEISLDLILSGIVAILLVLYLFYTLFHPEKF